MWNLPSAAAPLKASSCHARCSAYHLAGVTIADQACRGLACFVAREGHDTEWAASAPPEPRIYCLGKCYAAPARASDQCRPHIAIDAPQAIVLSRLAQGGAGSLQEYLETEGYRALLEWIRKRPEEILDEIEKSELRGRGGAGFPVGKKWRSVAGHASDAKYVVANGDEGDPGAYIDRFILEDDPHAVIEACILAGYSVGAGRGTVYVRKEYPEAQRVLASAIEEARRAGFLGSSVAGSGVAFELEIVSGQGSYVSGEETALLNSIEGKPPTVRPRPPYPAERGLWGRPTLVNNVETLVNIPWILRHGGAAYRALGFSHSRGTKVVSLNSLFRRPGLYEVEFGVPVRHLVENLGGGLRTGAIRGLIIGGPLAGILPPDLFDTRFGFEELQQFGASVGHGGVVAFDERRSLPELVHHVFEFAADESCGVCTPCRIGSRAVEQIFRRVVAQARSPGGTHAFVREVVSALRATSLCGLGTGLAEFALSAWKHYPQEMERAFRQD